MPISSEFFTNNTLFGATIVRNGAVSVSLPTVPFSFLGDQSFTLKLRRDGNTGPVIATAPTITLKDNAALVSFEANNYSVIEGDLIEFTLITTGAANNSILYYDTLATHPNVNSKDFIGPNTGSFAIVNNVGTIIIRSNTDLADTNENDETFRVRLRTGSVTGNIISITSNITIQDTSNTSVYQKLTAVPSNGIVIERGNVIFTLNTVNVSTVQLLYYYTSGNADNSSFVQGNTGSFYVAANGRADILLTTTSVPSNTIVDFQLNISETALGSPVSTSNTISIYDTELVYMNISGGTVITSGGYRTHVFTTSGQLNINNLGLPGYRTMDYLVVAGGGGGGGRSSPGSSKAAGGGGAGGLLTGSTALVPTNLGTRTVTVGDGAPVPAWPAPSVPAPGQNSVLGNPGNPLYFVASGGGPGNDGGAGIPGGSGGGGSLSPDNSPRPGGNGISGQGNPGGPGGRSNPSGNGGGGGGAGGPGGGPPSNNGGIGRPISWIPSAYGTPGPAPGRWFAGGGGGSGLSSGSGGAGGGGNGYLLSGTQSVIAFPTPGVDGTGGGGGGERWGGSGIVAVRYPYVPEP